MASALKVVALSSRPRPKIASVSRKSCPSENREKSPLAKTSSNGSYSARHRVFEVELRANGGNCCWLAHSCKLEAASDRDPGKAESVESGMSCFLQLRAGEAARDGEEKSLAVDVGRAVFQCRSYQYESFRVEAEISGRLGSSCRDLPDGRPLLPDCVL